MNDTAVSSSIEYTAQERAAMVTLKMALGEEATTAEIAEQFGMTWHGADKMMNRISRVIPLMKDGSRWKKFD